MKVALLTTSYPRDENDFAGRFVAETVLRLRERGVEIEVVGPGVYRDFGLAYGAGVVHNVRRRPWAAPLLLASMTRAVRRAAAKADLVHAYWLPAAAPAALSGRPFVVSLPGTDMELAARAPWLARPLLRRAQVVLAVSQAIAAQARGLGAGDVRVVPPGIEIPPEPGDEVAPAEVLFVGRLSPEKGIHDLMQAAEGLNLVVVGDGPLRTTVPNGLGYVSREELLSRYRRAAVVVCPSRRDGFPVACAEAMAYGRPVVASAVGGLPDMVVDGETGLLVPPRDPGALRAAIDRLLADPDLRRRLGRAARERISALCGWDAVVDATVSAYDDALAARRSRPSYASPEKPGSALSPPTSGRGRARTGDRNRRG